MCFNQEPVSLKEDSELSPTETNFTYDESEPITSGYQIHPLILEIIADMTDDQMKRTLYSETLLRHAITPDFWFDKVFFPKLAKIDYGRRFEDSDDTDVSSAILGPGDDSDTSSTSSMASEISHELKKRILALASGLPPQVNVLIRSSGSPFSPFSTSSSLFPIISSAGWHFKNPGK
eukprot:sb/3471887/